MFRARFGFLAPLALMACALIVALPGTARPDPRQHGDGTPGDHNGFAIRQGHHIEWQRASYRRAADGKTMVVWSDTRSGNRDVYVKLINPDGTPAWPDSLAAGKRLVSAAYRQEDPEVVEVNGGWIIAWIEFRTDSLGDVWAQKIDDNANLLWDPAGVVVDTLINEIVFETTLRAAHDGQGGAIIAWEDQRDDLGDIYAQRILANGTRAWPTPLLVVAQPNAQTGITADSDGQGNMVVAWNDQRDPSNQNIYVAKVTPNGQTPWGVDGRLVCGVAGAQSSVKICPDGLGGCYLAWKDQRTSAVNDLYCQRIDANGQPVWAADGLPLCTAPRDQQGVRVAVSMNNGTPDGLLTVWEDIRSNNHSEETYAQKVSLTGEMLWGENGLFICGDANTDTLNWSGSPRKGGRLTSDLAGGMLVAWDDHRESAGYEYTDLYAARVASSGSIVWGANGTSPIATGPHNQGAPLLRMDDNGQGVFIFYEDRRLGSLAVKYQKCSLANGAPMLSGPAEVIYGLDGNTTTPRSAHLGFGKIGYVWVDNRYVHRGPALYYQIADTTGELFLGMNGDTLAPDNESYERYDQTAPQICADGEGGFFVSFEDLRSGAKRIRLAHVDAQGNLTGSPAGQVIYSDATTGDQQSGFVTPDGEGGCYVVWSNLISSNYYIDIYVMRMNQACQPWPGWNGPVRLQETADEDIVYGVTSNPDGCCIVVWRSGEWQEFNVNAARVCRDGSISWIRPICEATSDQDNGVVFADGQGGAYFAWDDKRLLQNDLDIYAQHVNAQGEDLWAAGGIPVVLDSARQQKPEIAADAQGNLWVFWEDFRGDSSLGLDIFAQKLTPDGARFWQNRGRLVSGGPNDQKDVVLVPEWDNGIYAVWHDDRPYYTDVMGTHLRADGTPADAWWVDGIGGPICDYYRAQYEPTACTDYHGGIMTAWTDERCSGKEPLMAIWANWVNDYTVDVEELPSAAIPTKPELYQNYPNPFNPSTRIEFSLVRTERVQVEIFNTLGQRVATLVDRTLNAGRYQMTFKAESFASGMYFYRLKTPTFVDVKKMTLLR